MVCVSAGNGLIRIGRWSEFSAVAGVQQVSWEMWLLISVMSGELGFWPVGTLVGRSLFSSVSGLLSIASEILFPLFVALLSLLIENQLSWCPFTSPITMTSV